jgi:endonuclease/exonuclease/phosphatase family metal-dependent hydrolase
MDAEREIRKIMRDFDRAPEVRNADLFLLQEVAGSADGSASVAKDLAERLGMQFLFEPADPIGNGLMKGLAIVSRYPFHDPQILPLRHYGLHFKSRVRIAMAVTLESQAGAIRVINVHLDSRINKEQRIEQLKPLLKLADAARVPALIGGDFNTVKIYWVSHTIPLLHAQDQVTAVRTLMTTYGYSTPFGNFVTHRLGLRLDWIYLRGLAAVDNGVAPIPSSDHRAIWLTLQ